MPKHSKIIVIPIYNEETTIKKTLIEWKNELNKLEQSNTDNKSQDIPVNMEQSPNLTDDKIEKLTEELKLDKQEIIKPNLVEEQNKETKSNIQIDISDVAEPLENTNIPNHIDFSEKDMVVEPNGVQTEVVAPKDIETLEKISQINNARRKAEEEEEDDSLNIGGDAVLDLDIVSL